MKEGTAISEDEVKESGKRTLRFFFMVMSTNIGLFLFGQGGVLSIGVIMSFYAGLFTCVIAWSLAAHRRPIDLVIGMVPIYLLWLFHHMSVRDIQRGVPIDSISGPMVFAGFLIVTSFTVVVVMPVSDRKEFVSTLKGKS